MVSKENRLYSSLAVAGLATVLYMNTISGQFVFDDHEAIENNIDVRSDTPLSQVFNNDFWGLPLSNPESHKSYRPLVVLTFRLNRLLHDMWAPGFHIVNIVLHSLVCVLYQWMLCRLEVEWTVAFVASVLFAAHPIHTEAVSNIVGRTELLSAIFFILSFICYQHSLSYSNKTQKESISYFKRPISFSLTWISVCVCLSFVSLLCKEQGVTVLGVCLVYDYLLACQMDIPDGISKIRLVLRWMYIKVRRKEDCGRNLLPLWLVSFIQRCLFIIASGIVIVLFRLYINGRGSPLFVESDNPAFFSTHFLTRGMTYSHLVAVNLWLLLCPSRLCFDWSMDSVSLVEEATDPRNVATCALFVSFIMMLLWTSGIMPSNKQVGSQTPNHTPKAPSFISGTVHSPTIGTAYSNRAQPTHKDQFTRRYKSLVLLSLSLAVLPFLPASNLLFPVGFVIAERVLYLPSMGVCLLIAIGGNRIKCRLGSLRPLINILLMMVAIGFSVKTVFRNAEWSNTETLAKSAVHVNPSNAKVFMTLGNVYAQEGQRRCELFYREALRLRPRYASAWTNLGLVLLNTDRAEEAESCYRRALSIKPDHINANVNLGHLCRLQQRWSEASSHYLSALSRRPNNIGVSYYNGVVMEKMGGAKNIQSAQQQFERVLELQPAHWESHTALARILATTSADGRRLQFGFSSGNRLDKAMYHYQRALSIKPDQADEHYALAKIHLFKGKVQEAKFELTTAIKFAPDHSQAHFELGNIHQQQGDQKAAIHEFETVLRIDPTLNLARQRIQELS